VIRANERIRHALKGIRTTDVEVNYHCRHRKGYYTGYVFTRHLGVTRCRCGSNDLLLLSVAPEASSPLLGAVPVAGRSRRCP
jgi:hypothetical protein